MEVFDCEGGIACHFTGAQSSCFRSAAHVQLIPKEASHISSLKMPFHTERHCHIPVSIHEPMTVIEHIHSEGGT